MNKFNDYRIGAGKLKIKFTLPSIKVELITSKFDFSFGGSLKDFKLIETPLKKDEYYYKITIVFKTGVFRTETSDIISITQQYLENKLKEAISKSGKQLKYEIVLDYKK